MRTLVGSMIPDLNMSTNCEVRASYPRFASSEVATFSTTCVGLTPVFLTICVIGTRKEFRTISTPVRNIERNLSSVSA